MSDNPKTWGEMTDAEKGALLLADYREEQIEFSKDGKDWHFCPVWSEVFVENYYYRICPKPKRDTVELVGGESAGWGFYSDSEVVSETHRITFDTIDGQPDCDSIRMEPIK